MCSLFVYLFDVFNQSNYLEIHPCCIVHSFYTKYYLVVEVSYNSFTHLPVNKHLGCFQFGTLAHRAAMYIHVQDFV